MVTKKLTQMEADEILAGILFPERVKAWKRVEARRGTHLDTSEYRHAWNAAPRAGDLRYWIFALMNADGSSHTLWIESTYAKAVSRARRKAKKFGCNRIVLMP